MYRLHNFSKLSSLFVLQEAAFHENTVHTPHTDANSITDYINITFYCNEYVHDIRRLCIQKSE